jgi:formate dehydrogenase (NADP+) beta subunit
MSTKGTHIPDHLRVPFAGVTPAPTQEKGQDLFPTGNWRTVRPVYRDKKPPCNHACPAGERIQGYLDLVKDKKYLQAYALIKEDMPFPTITGRVCYHPCETACNRGDYDDAIGIHCVERFLGDYGLSLPNDVVQRKTDRKERVAVVGSGPAGMSAAYQLAREGYQVIVFEGQGKPGGLLRGGMPEFVLPEDILDKEIDRLKALGITFECNKWLGRDLTWDDLKGYDAAFLGLGLVKCRKLNAPGEDAKQGVHYGQDFLTDEAQGRPQPIGKRVAVIGGGNTAVDVVRLARRKGGELAMFICFESEVDAPALAEEKHLVREEGGTVMDTTVVKEILNDGARVTGIRIVKCKPGAKFPSQIEEIPGTEDVIAVDDVIVSIGQFADLSYVPEQFRTDRGLLKTDEYGRVDGSIFAAGDAVQGAGMVVQAVGAGHKAATNIHHLLNGHVFPTPVEPDVIKIDRLNLAYFRHFPRVAQRQVPLSDRLDSYVEVNLNYNEDEAVGEANRCFSCGTCNACDNCYVYCPDVSIARDDRRNGSYYVRTDYCKGCGVCIKECPTGCLEAVPELEFTDGVIRMETAFATSIGAHGRQREELFTLIGETLD